MENERLQRRVFDLRASSTLASMEIPVPLAASSGVNYSQAAFSAPHRTHSDPMIIHSQRPIEGTSLYYPGIGQGGYDDILANSIRHSFDGGRSHYSASTSLSNLEDNGSEDNQRKKKVILHYYYFFFYLINAKSIVETVTPFRSVRLCYMWSYRLT
jgi:hypothetical protein